MDTTSNENQIRTFLDSWVKAVQAKDISGIIAHHSEDILLFDMPPPMQIKGLAEYKKGWEHCPEDASSTFSMTELEIVADEKVAFCHAILGMKECKFRLTMGLRKKEGEWWIVHEHYSMPMNMENACDSSKDAE